MHRFLKSSMAGLALLGLAGCATGPNSAQTNLDTATVALTTLETAAGIYAALPDCSTTSAQLCANANIRARIAGADQQARMLLEAARTNPALLQSLLMAIENMRHVVPVG